MRSIEAKYAHSKYGNFMFELCAKGTRFLLKNRWLYYLLAFTWGSILTFLGLIMTAFLSIFKLCGCNISFKKFYWIYGILVGPNYWGGFETGIMYLRDQRSASSVDVHEFGHTFQNCILGPFTLILVTIPSALRYWLFTIKSIKGKENNVAYDSFWAEDSATQCGVCAVNYIKDQRNGIKDIKC